MRCFRLSHAGLVVEQDDSSLWIDPGNMSSTAELERAFAATATPAALVITHEHADHWTPEAVQMFREAAPEAPIFTTQQTLTSLEQLGISSLALAFEGMVMTAGPFELQIYGRRHELLHSSMPVIDNIGVRVNQLLAWGGDSLVRPPFTTDVLGIPVGSPWSNIGQVMDFTLNAAPKRAFLTHDGMLSDRGLALYTDRVRACLDEVGGQLITLPRFESEDSVGLSLTA